jgi:hypothetical protein
MMSSLGTTKDDGPREAASAGDKSSLFKCLHSVAIVETSVRIPPDWSHAVVLFEYLNTMPQRFGVSYDLKLVFVG